MKELKNKIKEILKESKEHGSSKCNISLPGKYHDKCYKIMSELQEEGEFTKFLDAEIVIGSNHPVDDYANYTITIPDPDTSLIIVVIF